MSKGDLTRSRISTTAAELFNTHGYANVTINDICEASGVTRSTFYYHFESKDAILDGLVDIVESVSKDELLTLVASSDYVAVLWEITSRGLRALVRAGREVARQQFIVSIQETRDPLERAGDERKANLLIEKAQKSGQIGNNSPSRYLVNALRAQQRGILVEWFSDADVPDPVQAFRETFDSLLLVTSTNSGTK